MHYTRILDLLDEESISGTRYKFDEKSYCECLKRELIAKVPFKIFFVHQHYLHIYGHQPDHIDPTCIARAG